MIYAISVNKLLSLLRPKKDLSDIEKEILRSFKSFSHFVDAPISELTRLGFNTNEILLIKSISHGVECYLDTKPKCINTTREAGKYIMSQIGFKEKEWMIDIYLNSKNKIVFVEKYSVYERTAVIQFIERVLTNCAKYGASKLIIGHNHPSGESSPSDADLVQYDSFSQELAEEQIELVDSIVATTIGYWSIRNEKNEEIDLY